MMLYSCTHVAPLGVKGLTRVNVMLLVVVSVHCTLKCECALSSKQYFSCDLWQLAFVH